MEKPSDDRSTVILANQRFVKITCELSEALPIVVCRPSPSQSLTRQDSHRPAGLVLPPRFPLPVFNGSGRFCIQASVRGNTGRRRGTNPMAGRWIYARSWRLSRGFFTQNGAGLCPCVSSSNTGGELAISGARSRL